MASPLHGDRMYPTKTLKEQIIMEGWYILSAIPKPSSFVYQQATVAFDTNTHERKSNL